MKKLQKFIYALIIALILNSAALVTAHFGDIKDLFASVVNFSITIEDGSGSQNNDAPEKPVNAEPAEGEQIAFPYRFRISAFMNSGNQPEKTLWMIRREANTYEFPSMSIDSTPGTNNLEIQNSTLGGGRYYWKARYLSTNGRWSDFSDETSFILNAPVNTVITTGGNGLYTGGYGVGGGGWSSGGGAYIVPKQTAPITDVQPIQKISPAPARIKIAPVQIKIEKEKYINGRPVTVQIIPKTVERIKYINGRPVKIRVAPEPKNIEINVQIKKKEEFKKTPVNKKQIVPIKKKSTKKALNDTKALGIGYYVAVLSYEDEETTFAFMEEFEVIPDTAPPYSKPLIWNEIALSAMLIGSTAFYSRRRILKKA